MARRQTDSQSGWCSTIGLGAEATRLVLDFVFHVLQRRNVLLETLGWNVAGLTTYERAGFAASAYAAAQRSAAGDPRTSC